MVPLPVVDEIVQRINDSSLIDMIYVPEKAALIRDQSE